MGEYLTSENALTKLCERYPTHPIKQGLKDVGIATGSIALGGLCALVSSIDMVSDVNIADPIEMGGTVVLGLGGAGAGIYYGLKGIHKLNPFSKSMPSEELYYVNNGFTYQINPNDKNGKIVVPVDDPKKFELDEDSLIFINGIRYTGTSADYWDGPNSFFEISCRYLGVNVEGRFKKKKYVPEVREGVNLHIVGKPLESRSGIILDVVCLGPAFRKTG